MITREEQIEFKVKVEIKVKKPINVSNYSDEDEQRENWENLIKSDLYGEVLEQNHDITNVEVE